MENVLASFDLETLEGQKKVFNAKSGASESLKNVEVGTELEVVDVLIHKELTDYAGQGEQESDVTTLFTSDGKAYAGISGTVASSAKGLIDFLAIAKKAGENGVKVRVTSQRSNQGRDFLNLQLV